MVVVFFFKQKTAYEMLRSLVGSEMCIRDRSSNPSGLAFRLPGTYNLRRMNSGMAGIGVPHCVFWARMVSSGMIARSTMPAATWNKRGVGMNPALPSNTVATP